LKLIDPISENTVETKIDKSKLEKEKDEEEKEKEVMEVVEGRM
jgi:hypothetical protein